MWVSPHEDALLWGQPFSSLLRGCGRCSCPRPSVAEHMGADQLISRYKSSLNFPLPRAELLAVGTAASPSCGDPVHASTAGEVWPWGVVGGHRVPACPTALGVPCCPSPAHQGRGLVAAGALVDMGLLGSCLSLRQGDQGASWGPFNFFPFSRKMKTPRFLQKLAPQRSFSVVPVSTFSGV